MLNYSGVLIYAFGRCFNPNAFTYEYCKKKKTCNFGDCNLELQNPWKRSV